MIQITLPDGAIREYNEGVTASEVAKSISEGLARKVLAAEVNGEVWDSSRPINSNASLKLLTWDDKNGKSTFWHSSAHLMAEALEALYPGVKLGIGPAIETGFYYDVDFGDREFSSDEFKKIEDNLASHFGTKVSLAHSKNGSGAITLEYYSLQELNKILDLMNVIVS